MECQRGSGGTGRRAGLRSLWGKPRGSSNLPFRTTVVRPRCSPGPDIRLVASIAILAVATAAVFVAGLASALQERTPTRATSVLYFGLGGLAGHTLGAFTVLAAYPWLISVAATDQVSATHAYVAINGLTMASDGIGNFFVGLSTLLAGWAITATPGFGAALGWFGIITGFVTALAGLAPQVSALHLGSFILPIVWLVWAGSALRRTA